MNQQLSAKWSFEKLAAAYEMVFASLTDEVINGSAPALPDEQMEAMNLTWVDVLVEAGWTVRQWMRVLDRETQVAA